MGRPECLSCPFQYRVKSSTQLMARSGCFSEIAFIALCNEKRQLGGGVLRETPRHMGISGDNLIQSLEAPESILNVLRLHFRPANVCV